jgi:hypothetical protein
MCGVLLVVLTILKANNMEQYIPKAALVAEIERRINEINLDIIEDWRYRLQREHDIEIMKNILSIIDTLEVKEVDLEKSISDWLYEGLPNEDELIDYIKETAKNFFELGMQVSNKVQKGE